MSRGGGCSAHFAHVLFSSVSRGIGASSRYAKKMEKMARDSLFKIVTLVLFCSFLVKATPVSIPLGSVSDLLIQSALDSLNDNSPTHHTYKSGNLISAQELLEPPYVVYRLTMNLEPNCNEDSPCPREACAIDLRRHELGVIDVQRNSIQCMYLYPQSSQTDVQQQQQSQDGIQEIANTQEQETIESFDKRTSNESVQLDHEVQTVTDGNDRPFIAVRAIDRNYCAGCPYELNPTLPGLAAFGEQVVQSMDDTGRSEFKHKVVSIVRVTRAVPPGSNVVLYELLLEIGETSCRRIGLSERTDCSLLINVPIQLCLVTFEQRPWQRDSRKIVRNNCTILPDTYNELNGNFGEPVATSESLIVSAVSRDVSQAASRVENYERIANEEKLAASYGTSIDEFFENVEPTATSGPIAKDTKIAVTEKSVKKIVLEREEEKREKGGFVDKLKEFDAFLDDFDVPIKNRDPEPIDRGIPVTEEIINPEIVVRVRTDRSNDVSTQNYEEQSEKQTREKRSIFDTTKDERNLVRKLAQKAVDELDEIDIDDEKRVLLAVLDSKKQLGNGTTYYITMKVATSNCEEGEKNLDDCFDDIREPAKICKSQIQTNSERTLETAKILQSQCYEELKRRQTRLTRQVVGGSAQRSLDDPEIRAYVDKGLRKFSETSGLTNEPFLVEIVEATSQVVSGMLYKIKVRLAESTCPKGQKKNCQLKGESQVDDYLITVWSQPWVDHGNPDIKVESMTEKNVKRVRRSNQMPGGVSTINHNDAEIRAYVDKGLRKFSETSGLTNEPFLVEIVEATSQVVSGMLYKIKVRLGESTCPKGQKENCQLKGESQVDDYLITVWSQPWIDHGNPDIKVESTKEKNLNRSRRSSRRVGGPTPKSPNDPEIRAYAEKGLRKFSETSGLTNEPFLVEVVEATSQVVSGMLYKIKVRLGESTCPKGQKENCQLKGESQVDDYLITVWSQPWIDHGNPDIKVESVTEKNVKRVRRSNPMTGGVSTINHDDPEIRAYVDKGLRKFSETSGLTNEPFLVEIVEATSQVVSGMLYKIKVRLGESTCPKGQKENCPLKEQSQVDDYLITVWSQPWIDHGNPDIKVEVLSNNNKLSKRSLRGANYSQKMLKLRKSIENEKVFEKFIKDHEKSYETENEKQLRFKIFQENLNKIEALRENEQGTAEYGATIFADLTPEEFRSKYLGFKPELKSENDIPFPMAEIPDIELPEEFDWRKQNVITEVKNQGSCGSCWAFSVTGNVEALNAIKHGKLLSLSEQELVDCDTLDQGCEGGLPDNAYRALENLGGLELESDYPYDGEDEKCHFDKTKARVNIVSGLNITSNETQMAQWLIQNGPITIGINANAMQFYMGGVSHPFKFLCNGDNLDHGVLIVGYGIHTYPIFKKSMPYWIIKNSWGPRWGEQGYYRVYRGDGTCGLNRMASSAVID